MIQFALLIASALALPDAPGDTLRTQQLEEVVVTKGTARQRLQSIQVGAEQLQLKELTAVPSSIAQQQKNSMRKAAS